LAIRLEFAGSSIIAFAALSAVLQHPSDDPFFPSLAGLSISFALSVTQSLNWTVRMASDLEAQMVSVERVAAYSQTPLEHERTFNRCSSQLQHDFNALNGMDNRTALGNTTAEDDLGSWPRQGRLVITNLTLCYSPGAPPVIMGLNCSIRPGEKIGVCGRTGAGKSTLLLGMLRLIEPMAGQGTICLDGLNIYDQSVRLDTLRNAIATIPQDPVLFSGTVRLNLDPVGDFSDTVLLDALSRVQMLDQVEAIYKSQKKAEEEEDGGGSATTVTIDIKVPLPFPSPINPSQRAACILEAKVDNDGTNFSVGQRQLLCIARALLRQCCLVLLDEATSSVDIETDLIIQQQMRNAFTHATVITIAHRINTIGDSDRVMVLERGRLVEFDSPKILMGNKNSLFYGLVHDSESY